MRLGIRARLFLFAATLVAVALGISYYYSQRQLSADATSRIRDELAVRTRLVTQAVQLRHIPEGSKDAWDALADELGKNAQGRVTVIARTGEVLGDSEVAREALARMENHATRPEVIQALNEGFGSALRYSSTVNREMLYAAIPFEQNGGGVARVALPRDRVVAVPRSLRRELVIGLLLALGVALILSTAAVELASRGARSLTAAARRMAEGALETRTQSVGSDELAELGRTLDALAEGLSGSLDKLQVEHDRLAGVLRGMGEGLLLIGHDGRVALTNPTLHRMFQIPDDPTGRPPIEAIRHPDFSRMLQAAKATQDQISEELELRSPTSRTVLVRITAGESGILAVFVDVTQLRKLEAVRREFVANASHELRNPIAAIQSATETLQDGAADNPQASHRFLNMISRNATRLGLLVNDLLELSRLESDEFAVELQTVDIATITENTVSNLSAKAEAKEIDITMELAVTRVVGDAVAVERVLTNLVENAIKYCPPGAKIRIGTTKIASGALVSVEDDGPGISPIHQDRVFERFYRVDTGRSRELGGTGLGLSIVKHLVEAMGSKIELQSATGKGARFVFHLPKARRPSDGKVAHAHVAQVPSSSRDSTSREQTPGAEAIGAAGTLDSTEQDTATPA